MRVLYVSKPIVPPWHDGSKNLVRDLAEHVPGIEPSVLATSAPSTLSARVQVEAVYPSGTAGFSPKATDNARVMQRLLRTRGEALWHFVFAPNPASSMAAHMAMRAQRLLRGKKRPQVVQTVASAPRSYARIERLLFGDVVVAQSEHTAAQLRRAGSQRRVVVIPPCARAPEAPGPERVAAARHQFGLGPRYVVYPGDLEVSSGADTVLAAAEELTAMGLEVVFACRAKTPRAAERQAELQAKIPAELADKLRFVGTVADLPALLAGAFAIVFPVDDLYGKVDLPLVLLEALALGVPLVVASGGPLTEIRAARAVAPKDPQALAAAVRELSQTPARWDEVVAAGRAEYAERFCPEVVAAAYGALYRELSA